MAVPFDEERLEVTGGTIPLVEGVVSEFPGAFSHFTVSRNGSLVYVPAVSSNVLEGKLVWVERDGSSVPLSEAQARFEDPPHLSRRSSDRNECDDVVTRGRFL